MGASNCLNFSASFWFSKKKICDSGEMGFLTLGRIARPVHPSLLPAWGCYRSIHPYAYFIFFFKKKSRMHSCKVLYRVKRKRIQKCGTHYCTAAARDLQYTRRSSARVQKSSQRAVASRYLVLFVLHGASTAGRRARCAAACTCTAAAA